VVAPRDELPKARAAISRPPEALPSDLTERREAAEMATKVLALLSERGVNRFGLRIHRAGEYPVTLRDARNPVELIS
jgi:DNA processing protein